MVDNREHKKILSDAETSKRTPITPYKEQVKPKKCKKKKAPYDNKTELDSVTCLHTVPKHITVFFG